MLMLLTVAAAELSALSRAVPVTDWLAPLDDSVVAPGQLLIPDRASEQVNDAVTSVLLHPSALAAGLREPLIVGTVLSSLTVTEPLPALPSRSVAVEACVVPVTGVLLFCESVAGVGPPPTPDPASLAAQAIPTLPLFQPAAFGAGDSAAVTTGPVLSSRYDA